MDSRSPAEKHPANHMGDHVAEGEASGAFAEPGKQRIVFPEVGARCPAGGSRI